MSVTIVDSAGPHLNDLSNDIIRCLCVEESSRVTCKEVTLVIRSTECPNEPFCEASSTPTFRKDRAVSSPDANSKFNYDETPLMFSRSSSLSSLNSVEHHSLHDDASVVSEFSQFASGIVSPSELPDSPTQGISDTFHLFKTTSSHDVTNHSLHDAPNDVVFCAKDDIFDDGVTPFKEEGTPIEFSRTTSLSALTCDQEPLIANYNTLLQGLGVLKRAAVEKQDDNVNTKVVKRETRDVHDTLQQFCLSEEEEGEEDMLAACISMGMQGCHKRRKCPPGIDNKRSARSAVTQRSKLPVLCETLPSTVSSQFSGMPTFPVRPIESMEFRGVCDDALLPYNSEGATGSFVDSQSELSMLSISSCGKGAQLMNMLGLVRPKEENGAGTSKEANAPPDLEKDFDDSVSNMSEDCEDILEECIRSGMPKARTS